MAGEQGHLGVKDDDNHAPLKGPRTKRLTYHGAVPASTSAREKRNTTIISPIDAIVMKDKLTATQNDMTKLQNTNDQSTLSLASDLRGEKKLTKLKGSQNSLHTTPSINLSKAQSKSNMRSSLNLNDSKRAASSVQLLAGSMSTLAKEKGKSVQYLYGKKIIIEDEPDESETLVKEEEPQYPKLSKEYFDGSRRSSADTLNYLKTPSDVEYRNNLKCIFRWWSIWDPTKQRAFLNTLLKRIKSKELSHLATVLEPSVHRGAYYSLLFVAKEAHLDSFSVQEATRSDSSMDISLPTSGVINTVGSSVVEKTELYAHLRLKTNSRMSKINKIQTSSLIGRLESAEKLRDPKVSECKYLTRKSEFKDLSSKHFSPIRTRRKSSGASIQYFPSSNNLQPTAFLCQTNSGYSSPSDKSAPNSPEIQRRVKSCTERGAQRKEHEQRPFSSSFSGTYVRSYSTTTDPFLRTNPIVEQNIPKLAKYRRPRTCYHARREARSVCGVPQNRSQSTRPPTRCFTNASDRPRTATPGSPTFSLPRTFDKSPVPSTRSPTKMSMRTDYLSGDDSEIEQFGSSEDEIEEDDDDLFLHNSNIFFKWYDTTWTILQKRKFIDYLLRVLDEANLKYTAQCLVQRRYKDFLSELPHNVALHILSFLQDKDICILGCVSRAWNALANEESVWKLKVSERDDFSLLGNTKAGSATWKEFYSGNYHLRQNWTHGNCEIIDIDSRGGRVLDVVSDNSRVISAGMDKLVKVWNIKTGELMFSMKGHKRGVWCLTKHTTNLCASGSFDNTIRVWNVRTGSCEQTMKGHKGAIWCICSNGSSTVVSGSCDHTLKIWDMAIYVCKKTLHGHTNSVYSCQIKDIYVYSSSADKTIRQWALDSGKCLRVLGPFDATIMSISVDSMFLAAAVWDIIYIIDLRDNTIAKILKGHSARIESIKFKLTSASKLHKKSINGILVSSSRDRTIREWDVKEGIPNQIFKLHRGAVNGIDISSDKMISCSDDETIKIYDFSI
eukprot:Nk52_evm11s2356 gene=Nk52_evmTU11s2356